MHSVRARVPLPARMSVPVSSLAARGAHAASPSPAADRSATPDIAATPRTFARRRLLLGITGVGTSVMLSLLWLLLLLTGTVTVSNDWRIVGGALGLPATAALLVLLVFVVHTLLLAPVEFVGGVRAVREPRTPGAWLRGWIRGVLVQGALFTGLTFALALAASQLGWFGAVAMTCAGGVLLLAAQGVLAQLVAPLGVQPADDAVQEIALTSGVRGSAIRVVAVDDEAFVGGWVGLGKPQLWIPARWTSAEHRDLLAVQLVRRHAQFESGARRRALWRAVLWPALSLAVLVPLLPWSFTDNTLWLALPAVSTLWTFVAVLLLPSVSRPVVYNADRAAASRLGQSAVVRAIRQLDAWQDDEPERAPGVEFVFHPVPSRRNRERALQASRRGTLGGAHQQTRLTLFTSLASGSLLGRMVHCNIGRPALWMLYPGD